MMDCKSKKECEEHGVMVPEDCEAYRCQHHLDDLLESGHAIVKDGVVFNITEKLFFVEECEACMLAMDKAGVPRFDEKDIGYSLWGRACWMARNLNAA